MARTRATKTATTKAAPSRDDGSSSASASKHALPAASTRPPKILILPSAATPDARVVSLHNPRYAKPTRYLVCPATGAYEFVRIATPNATPRSWLIESRHHPTASTDAAFDALVTKGADLYLATAIDPLFMALPALAAQFSSSSKRMFLSSDDHIETIAGETPHLRETIVRWPAWRKTFEARMAAVCDTVEAGDAELMFRFSETKLLAELLAKAKRMSKGDLPKSMEDKFVRKALEAPVLGVKKSSPVAVAALQTEDSTASESQASQSSAATAATSTATTTSSAAASEASTAATSVADHAEAAGAKDLASAIIASAEVVHLQRLRTAFQFICSCYVPPSMAAVLKEMLLQDKRAVDFAPLEDYVAQLTKLRQEALLARSASDYSRKRTSDEDNEERMEKRRKKEEEEKRKKAGESRGVRDLKKVNTAGMQKLSAFFKPKGA